MELIGNAWHIISAAAVFVLGALVAVTAAKSFRTSAKRSLALYLWHTLFCFAYIFYVRETGGDALSYYESSLSGNIKAPFGTATVQLFAGFLRAILGFSILGAFLVFNIIGFIGLLAFDASLQHATSDKRARIRRIATLVVLLPSVSFWSSAIGKDAFSFMAVGLAMWAALNLNGRAWMMGVAIVLMLLVRPHMAALMVMAVAVSMFIQPRVSPIRRLLVGSVALSVGALMIPFAMSASGLGSEAGQAAIADYIEIRQSHNMEGGGGVDIASMSLPAKLLTYLFRPLPFEAHNIPSLAASLDNIVLLLLVVVGLGHLARRRRASVEANRMFMWVYSLSALLILALTSANLGISMRQKWMFVPMLIFLLISVIGKPRNRVPPRHYGAFPADLPPRSPP